MRNQPNMQVLRQDKRVDALIKKQEGEHQHLISSHCKEMQTLRDSVSLAMEKFQSLFERQEKELNDFKTYTVCQIGILKEKIVISEGIITEQKNKIDDVYNQLHSFHVIYSSKVDLDKFKKNVDSQINETTVSHIVAIQELQRELKVLFNFLKDDFTKHKNETEKKICEIIENAEKNFKVNKIDREGVLKEIRIWEKTIFIIEKKIENIYTLIERINTRGEICHKPE